MAVRISVIYGLIIHVLRIPDYSNSALGIFFTESLCPPYHIRHHVRFTQVHFICEERSCACRSTKEEQLPIRSTHTLKVLINPTKHRDKHQSAPRSLRRFRVINEPRSQMLGGNLRSSIWLRGSLIPSVRSDLPYSMARTSGVFEMLSVNVTCSWFPMSYRSTMTPAAGSTS